MAVIAIVTSGPRDAEGGHLVLARSLVAAAREQGHDAHLVVTPDYGFGRNVASYRASWSTDLRTIDGRTVDQVISLRYPAYAVRHTTHLCWFGHAQRDYYDLWPRFAGSISTRARIKERGRKALIHAADWWLMHYNVSDVIAQSRTIQRRVREDFGIYADVILPPPPQRPYRCDAYGDYIFAISRLTPLKRMDLPVRALAEPAARHVKLVIAGDGEDRAEIESLARALGVGDRVTFVGRIDDHTLLDHLARCRAVCFPPLNEDYGFVTVEAFASRKAVVTCRDSGGPTELVQDGVNGFVCDATAASLAVALGRVTEDEPLAEQLGTAGATQIERMKWSAVVKRLVIV